MVQKPVKLTICKFDNDSLPMEQPPLYCLISPFVLSASSLLVGILSISISSSFVPKRSNICQVWATLSPSMFVAVRRTVGSTICMAEQYWEQTESILHDMTTTKQAMKQISPCSAGMLMWMVIATYKPFYECYNNPLFMQDVYTSSGNPQMQLSTSYILQLANLSHLPYTINNMVLGIQ